MNLVRRNPSSLAAFRPRGFDDQFGRLIESMFDDMLAPFAQGASMAQEGIVSPRLNVSENDQAFQVQAELPGVKKEDVKVAVEHQRITIEAESRRENERRDGENVLYTERSASKFMRSFVLPAEVDEASAEARMENGVLTLTLPKKQGGAAKRLTIQ